MKLTVVASFSAWLVATALVLGQAAAPKTVWDGAYTQDQADRGRSAYAGQCASCHGPALEGGEGAALVGKPFWDKWREQSVGDLLAYVSKNMPLHTPGTLSPTTYGDIVAHVLKANDLPIGPQELTPETSASIRIVAKDGSGELPASTLARIVGCLAPRAADGTWHVTRATVPERANAATMAPAEASLGNREFVLKFVLTPLTSMVGQRVVVTGLLLGEGGVDGVNVSTVKSVAPACN